MSTTKKLPVVYEGQAEFYKCGPACINMVLSRWGKNYNQEQVWDAVKANTFPLGPRPLDALQDAGSFANQLCEFCRTQTQTNGTVTNVYECWYTSPGAMATTIAASSSTAVTVSYIPNTRDAVKRMADSITTWDTPAVYTTAPGLHWMVAYGYEHQPAQPPPGGLSSTEWNGQHIVGIYAFNPSSAPTAVSMVTPCGLDDLLMKIGCGVNAGTYPIVGGRAPQPWWVYYVQAFVGVARSLFNPNRHRTSPKHPQNPPVPPPPSP